jgi:hypothetical protein
MKQHFAVIVQRTSKWDNSTPPEQQPGFPDHLAYMGGLEKSGAIALAGLMTSTNDVLFVFLAESEDEVRDLLGKDPWQREGKVCIARIEQLALRIGNIKI